MDPVKVKGIADWPAPHTLKQLRSFIGFCNFYHKFILRFSDKCKPLNELLKKNIPWDWTPDRHSAFEDLKLEFQKEPVLRIPDQNRPFRIEADASKWASGAVLSQADSNGDWHPVAYLSKTFNQAEQNYQVYDRELLAIIHALQEWRHYIQGAPHKTLVLSDHCNLTYFRKPQKFNRLQARWAIKLAEYDIDLKHLPGNKMIPADALSHRSDHCPNEDNDNEDEVLLTPDLFIQFIDTTLLSAVADMQRGDPMALEALQLITGKGILDPLTDVDNWTVETDSHRSVLFYKGKIYIPDDLEL